jgi:hypothetical protein
LRRTFDVQSACRRTFDVQSANGRFADVQSAVGRAIPDVQSAEGCFADVQSAAGFATADVQSADVQSALGFATPDVQSAAEATVGTRAATAATPAQSTRRTRFDGACSDFPTMCPPSGGFAMCTSAHDVGEGLTRVDEF